MNISLSLKSLLDVISTKPLSEGDLEKYLEEFTLRLVENDVAYELARSTASSVINTLSKIRVPRLGSDLRELVANSVKEHLLSNVVANGIDYMKLVSSSLSNKTPFVHMFIGVNGTGKTTTIAKIALMLKRANLKPLMVCADTFRAGAVEQLRLHAERVGVPCFEKGYGKDPASVAFDALELSRKDGYQAVLIDTAGRFHTRKGLMEELGKIKRISSPDHTTLVVDAMAGNDSWEQAKTFMELIGYDSIILTKFDADVKGGAALSVSYISKKPIIFVGTGQDYDDIKEFNIHEFVEELFARI